MMNDKARAIFEFIVRFQEEHGFSPTIREIETQFQFRSTNSVRLYLDKLVRHGYIERPTGKARSIRVLRQLGDGARFGAPAVAGASRVAEGGRPGPGIPLVGRIAAGPLLLAEENVEGHLALDDLFPGSDLFALRVKGQSMRDRGILDGDLVVVRKQEYARDGDAVVALVGDDATLKTCRRSGEGVDLVPENPEFSVVHVGPHEDFRVVGVVVGLVRSPSVKGRPQAV